MKVTVFFGSQQSLRKKKKKKCNEQKVIATTLSLRSALEYHRLLRSWLRLNCQNERHHLDFNSNGLEFHKSQNGDRLDLRGAWRASPSALVDSSFYVCRRFLRPLFDCSKVSWGFQTVDLLDQRTNAATTEPPE